MHPTSRLEQTDRRQFVQGALGLSVAALGFTNPGKATSAFLPKPKTDWSIGCFNRPWGSWSYDDALKAMVKAGFGLTGLLGDHKDEPFVQAEATVDHLLKLKERLAEHKLKANIVRLKTRHDIPLAKCKEEARKQIVKAHLLGIESVFSMGVDSPAQFDHYVEVMQDSCSFAADKGMKIAVKPHGGISASADEILKCFEKVKRKNFGLWYDAGNIIHYTGKDPVDDLSKVSHLVVGFCAKDCLAKGGDVMIPFGSGKVDFAGVFGVLKKAGFAGPVMVECCKVGTLEETTENARKNREFLEGVLAKL